MKYGFTRLATDWDEKDMDHFSIRMIRTPLFFIPQASPDHEKLYPRVSKWFIEVDDSGVPVRELGMDKDNVPLFGAPDERNFGFWTDSNKTFELEELELSTQQEFDALWQRLRTHV
ncbi:MAG: hypothetical protein OIF51_15940 [Cellvibrionaceae bacterium]|nr:hypothetical protein [Cellvibrionaceae bacterium]